MGSSVFTAFQQFTWGAFGGCLIVLSKIILLTAHLTSSSPFPQWNFKLCMLLVGWVAGVIVSGVVSIACESHNRFIAIYEGMSLPALLLAIAQGL